MAAELVIEEAATRSSQLQQQEAALAQARAEVEAASSAAMEAAREAAEAKQAAQQVRAGPRAVSPSSCLVCFLDPPSVFLSVCSA